MMFQVPQLKEISNLSKGREVTKPTTNSWSRAIQKSAVQQSLSYSRISPHFMEPSGSLSCSQEPATGPSRNPDESSLYHSVSAISILILSCHLRLFHSSFPI
jgi:hypothetical protein